MRESSKLEDCPLPSELFYDVDNDVWLRPLDGSTYRVGVAVPLLFKVGKLSNVKPRPVGTVVKRGQSLALLESQRFTGPLWAPLQGEIAGINESVVAEPGKVAEDPYGDGWVVELKTHSDPILAGLLTGEDAIKRYEEKIDREGIVCLKSYPDHRITALAETCEMILTKVGDYFFKFVKPGETLHVVTQDPATEVDMLKWARDMGQELVDMKRRGKLIHVLYRRL